MSQTQRRYRAGQAEHGGCLWRKPGMLAHATDEAIDLGVYLLTLREQMDALIVRLEAGELSGYEAAGEIRRWLAP